VTPSSSRPEQVVGATLRVSPRQPAELADHHEVLAAGERDVDRGVLSCDTDAAAHFGSLRDDVEACDASVSAVGPRQRGEDAQGRRLPRPVRSQHAEQGAFVCVQVDAGKGLRVAVALGQALGLDHGSSHPGFPQSAYLLVER